MTGCKQMGMKPLINHPGTDREAYTCPWMPTDDRQHRSFAACCVNLKAMIGQLSEAVVCIDQTGFLFFYTYAKMNAKYLLVNADEMVISKVSTDGWRYRHKEKQGVT